jgi:hypothetical protein
MSVFSIRGDSPDDHDTPAVFFITYPYNYEVIRNGMTWIDEY